MLTLVLYLTVCGCVREASAAILGKDSVCKIKNRALQLLLPHEVKGFRLRGALLGKNYADLTKTCISPDPEDSENAVIALPCSSLEIQLWNMELHKELPGRSWFRLVSNHSSENCLTLSDESTLRLDRCELGERGQWWALIQKVVENGTVVFPECPHVFTLNTKATPLAPDSGHRYWTMDKTRTVPCKKLKSSVKFLHGEDQDSNQETTDMKQTEREDIGEQKPANEISDEVEGKDNGFGATRDVSD